MSLNAESIVAREAAQAPALVRALFRDRVNELDALVETIVARDPAIVVTAARGSSDNTGLWFSYLVQIASGLPVASLPLSVASIYQSPLQLERALFVALSQSGASPDLMSAAAAARGRRRAHSRAPQRHGFAAWRSGPSPL